MTTLPERAKVTKFLTYYKLKRYDSKLSEDVKCLNDIRTLNLLTVDIDDKLEDMLDVEQIPSMHKNRFKRAFKELENGTYSLEVQGTNENIHKADNQQQSKVGDICYGWINLSVNGSTYIPKYCVFKTKKKQILVYDENQINNGKINGHPVDIIWLGTCEIRNVEYKLNAIQPEYIELYDHATEFVYKINACDEDGTCEKLRSYIELQCIDIIWQDVESRQRFNRFLSMLRKTMQAQTQQLSKICEKAEEIFKVDVQFSKEIQLLYDENLVLEERIILQKAINFRNQFWNNLSDTRRLISDDYVKSSDVYSNLLRWKPILAKKGHLTEKEIKILRYGIKQMRSFVDNKKIEKMKILSEQWKRLVSNLSDVSFKSKMQKMNKKWNKKASDSQLNRYYWGIFALAAAAIGIACVVLCTPIALLIAAGCGIAAIYSLYRLYNNHTQVGKEKEMANRFKLSISEHDAQTCDFQIDQWLESIALMKVSFQNIHNHELFEGEILLRKAEYILIDGVIKAFGTFSTRCKNSLVVLREVHQNILKNK